MPAEDSPASPLTQAERGLQRQIEELIDRQALDHHKVHEISSERRLDNLKRVWERHVRATVVHYYVFVDEILNGAILRDLFAGLDPSDEANHRRFRTFRHRVLDRLAPPQKLEMVADAWGEIPERKRILELNDLRNGLAHSLFPKFRRSPPLWRGIDIYEPKGIHTFLDDLDTILRTLTVRYAPRGGEGCEERSAPTEVM